MKEREEERKEEKEEKKTIHTNSSFLF